MASIDHACRRITAAIDEIERLRESDFPYPHAREALLELDRMFRAQLDVLKRIPAGAAVHVANNACSASLYQLFVYVPILGFILRSTNVRNAFEAYAPLLRLARGLLGPDTKLILSSEWDYSPFVYMPMTDLPGFVLIGLPAPESANPLLVPLAGHELGHWLWQKEGLAAQFEKDVEKGVLDELRTKRWKEYNQLHPHSKPEDLQDGTLFSRLTWRPAFTWAMLQAEETFCDFVGVRLFAESFLHAFSYLLSPRALGKRSSSYPNIVRRAAQLSEAASQMGVDVPPDFQACFEAEDEHMTPDTQMLVGTADVVSASLVSRLIAAAREICERKSAPSRSTASVSAIATDFEKVVPTAQAASLCDFMNAGWKCHLDSDLWKSVRQIRPENRDRVLRDLILKSAETLEVTERMKGTA